MSVLYKLNFLTINVAHSGPLHLGPPKKQDSSARAGLETRARNQEPRNELKNGINTSLRFHFLQHGHYLVQFINLNSVEAFLQIFYFLFGLAIGHIVSISLGPVALVLAVLRHHDDGCSVSSLGGE